jgi:hypothetical protein
VLAHSLRGEPANRFRQGHENDELVCASFTGFLPRLAMLGVIWLPRQINLLMVRLSVRPSLPSFSDRIGFMLVPLAFDNDTAR